MSNILKYCRFLTEGKQPFKSVSYVFGVNVNTSALGKYIAEDHFPFPHIDNLSPEIDFNIKQNDRILRSAAFRYKFYI